MISCVPPHTLYLRSFISSDILVQLRFEDESHLDSWMEYHAKLSVRKNVSNFNKTGNRFFKDTIEVVSVSPLVVQYVIPARSVTIFGSAWYFDFAEMEIKGDNIDRMFYANSLEMVDRTTGEQKKVDIKYKWLGNYFFDII